MEAKIALLQREKADLAKQLAQWKTAYRAKQKRPIGLQDLDSDDKVKRYTGIESKEVFEGIYSALGDDVKDIRQWHGPARTVIQKCRRAGKKTGPKRTMTSKEEYFLILFRTKTGLNVDIVGDLFGISATLVSRICTTWWKFLAKVLSSLIFNPTPEAHQALLPQSFQPAQYRKVQHIIDCTEFFIETPKNKEVQAFTFSNYKHHNSITPLGLINFVSDGLGGRASDRQIIEKSGFLEEIVPGEQNHGR